MLNEFIITNQAMIQEFLVKLNNHPFHLYIYGTIITTAILYKLLANHFWSFWLFTSIGTMAHELAHFTISFLTNGKPRGFNLIPYKEGDYYVLGSITSNNSDWYNQALISLAPVLLLPISFIFLNSMILTETSIIQVILKSFIFTNLFIGSLPSISDFKSAIQKPIGILLLFGFVYYFYDIIK
jgi:hypothetical protein